MAHESISDQTVDAGLLTDHLLIARGTSSNFKVLLSALQTLLNDTSFTATETDSEAIRLVVDAAGLGDVKALDIDYISGLVEAMESEAIVLINIDETGSTGGNISGFEVLSTSEGSASIYGMRVGVNVGPIHQEVGTFGDMDSMLVKAVDQLAALVSGGAGNVSVFVADDDTITIGDAATFGELEIVLGTGASGSGIAPVFEFSTGVDTWDTFVPTDGTEGFRNTGLILWDAADLSTWAVGTGSEYLIRITRTRNSLSTTPILDEVQIAALTEYTWDKDGALSVATLTVGGTPVKSFTPLLIAASNETTALSTGTAKFTFRMPGAFVVTGVRASVGTAPTGSVLTVDINDGGTTILSTKLTIDATEKTSTTAATPAVVSDTALADDAEITVDIDGIGSTIAGAGLKVYLLGYYT